MYDAVTCQNFDRAVGIPGPQGILLTAYLKLRLAAPEDQALQADVDAVYERYGRSVTLVKASFAALKL